MDCSCGNPEAHVIARRTSNDGLSIQMWDDGAITGRFGFKLPGVPVSRPRTPEAIGLTRRAGTLFLGEVCLYDQEEFEALYAACLYAAKRDGLPGTVRERLRASQKPVLHPVWTTLQTDRDGVPTARYWLLPRVRWPGLAIWDHVSSSRGRYEVMTLVPGTLDSCETTGIRFDTLSALADHLFSLEAP